MKLQFIKVERDKTPDHILEEIRIAVVKMARVLEPIVKDIPPPILFAAYSDLFTGIQIHLVEETAENLRHTAKLNAQALIENMERVIVAKGIK